MQIKNKIWILFALFFLLQYSVPAFSYTEEAINTYDKGVDLVKKGYMVEALEQFNKAISIDADFVDAYYNAGALYEHLNKNDKAIQLFEILLSKTPEDNQIKLKLGQLYYNKANYSKALFYLNNISSDAPEYNEGKLLMAKSQTKLSAIRKKQELQRILASKTIVSGFNGPTGITEDSKGNLFIANYSTNKITKLMANGQKIIINKPEFINGPIGIVADNEDNIYIANYKSNKVVRMTPEGKFENLITLVKNPYYLYIDKNGYLYITEQGTNTLIRLKITEHNR